LTSSLSPPAASRGVPSLVIFLEAIAAAGFGYLILGEPVTLVQALGGVAILGGTFVARPR
jgi:drug/metabolite transporter (DMT)-like permease